MPFSQKIVELCFFLDDFYRDFKMLEKDNEDKAKIQRLSNPNSKQPSPERQEESSPTKQPEANKFRVDYRVDYNP